MHYQDERTNGCRVSDAWTYRGLKTVVLENDLIRVIVLADKGADVYSFVHKATDTDFMWRTPWGVRDPSKFVPTTGAAGSLWLDQYEGGWQTVVPHGGFPDSVYGAEMGLHGEVNTMPWDCQVVEDSPHRVAVRFRAKGVRMPFSAEKTLSVEAGSAALPVDESVTIYVTKATSALTVEDAGGKMLFHAPVTSGSEHDPLPIGQWKVTTVQRMPTFNYNPDLFWDADPKHAKATIPSGPNNPVGTIWIDLTKEHYGIHGTPEPSTVGHTQSHGCVRLTNWDVQRVARWARPGTPVIFR